MLDYYKALKQANEKEPTKKINQSQAPTTQTAASPSSTASTCDEWPWCGYEEIIQKIHERQNAVVVESAKWPWGLGRQNETVCDEMASSNSSRPGLSSMPADVGVQVVDVEAATEAVTIDDDGSPTTKLELLREQQRELDESNRMRRAHVDSIAWHQWQNLVSGRVRTSIM